MGTTKLTKNTKKMAFFVRFVLFVVVVRFSWSLWLTLRRVG